MPTPDNVISELENIGFCVQPLKKNERLAAKIKDEEMDQPAVLKCWPAKERNKDTKNAQEALKWLNDSSSPTNISVPALIHNSKIEEFFSSKGLEFILREYVPAHENDKRFRSRIVIDKHGLLIHIEEWVSEVFKKKDRC